MHRCKEVRTVHDMVALAFQTWLTVTEDLSYFFAFAYELIHSFGSQSFRLRLSF